MFQVISTAGLLVDNNTCLDAIKDLLPKKLLTINQGKSKVVSFTRALVKDPLNYFFGDQRIPEGSSCEYLGIIFRSDLSWAVQVNFRVQKAWKALHVIMRILKKRNSNTKS